MKTRTITAAWMLATTIPILIWGYWYHIFDAFCLLLSLWAAYEFRKMFSTVKKLPRWLDLLTIIFTGGMFAIMVLAYRYPILIYLFPYYGLFLVLVHGCILVFLEDYKAVDFGNSFATILYCSLGFASLAILRGTTANLSILFYLLLVAMMTDLFAYYIGTFFGKHKLCPTVSPKKTIEGAVAGLLGGSGVASLFAILAKPFGLDFPWWGVLLMSLVLSFLSQVGDLVASKFKRSYGIKDYSNLFPGHGGVLDRFDSSMFAAAALTLVLGLIQAL